MSPPSLSQAGVEDLVDMIGDMGSLPRIIRDAVPDNYRAMVALFVDHFDLTIPLEYVYDICPE